MSPRDRATHARRAALLFCVSGALAIVNAWIPGICPAEQKLQFTALGLLDLGVAALLIKLPWDRWSPRALLAVPVLAVAYVFPLLHAGEGRIAATTAGVVVPMIVVLAEVIARSVSGLREQSARDDLTGVGNRRHGMAALARLRPGDAVLASLGALLRRSMRGADAVARLGGEEFLVVASQVGGSAESMAERLVEDWRGTAPRTTVSVGVTVHREGEDPEVALARADRALYDAKRAGRDRSIAG